MKHDFHEIAAIFPLLEGAEFNSLVDDVSLHGVREPIWLYEGKILDGRNRYRAAIKSGAKYNTRDFVGTKVEAVAFVWSMNYRRRHLSPSQAAIADARRNKLYDAYAAVRVAAKERQARTSVNREKAASLVKVLVPEQEKDDPAPQTRDVRAQSAGTNAKYIDLADKLVNDHPDLAAEVEAGKKTLSQVQRVLRQAELNEKAPPAPTGKYRVIYADPPWKYNDALAISKNGLGESYGPAEAHYPAMSVSELCALPISDLSEDNAALFLWTTSPLLEDTFKVIKAWGFKYKASFVWDKIKHNMGHYNSVRHEFLLVCTKGSCTPDVKKLFDSVQSIERLKHSQKPEQFREIIDTLYTHGEKLEMFRRGDAPVGWKVWGNQANENT